MVRYWFVLTVLIIGISLMAGCACNTSRLEMDFGTSFGLAKFNQTLNPESGENSEPVCGLDGQAAMETIEKYRDGFKPCSSPTGNFMLK